jgi:glycerol kinase
VLAKLAAAAIFGSEHFPQSRAHCFSGIATGFWTEEWVLHGSDTEDTATTFQPSIPAAEATERLAKWDRAVKLSYGLADSMPELGK